jgi:DNA (cytosine-5)-methyltransferase 1
MLKQSSRSAARGTDTPWYQGWELTEAERAVFRATTLKAQEAKRRALRGECDGPKHPVNVPALEPADLMPRLRRSGFTALSLFSGGGGMDIGFDRAGFSHAANYELLTDAAEIIRAAHPKWTVYGGAAGDVTRVRWAAYGIG